MDILNKIGINPSLKKSYAALFSKKNETAQKVLDDLCTRFNYYGSPWSKDQRETDRNIGRREVVEYILKMSCRLSDETLQELEKFLNR